MIPIPTAEVVPGTNVRVEYNSILNERAGEYLQH